MEILEDDVKTHYDEVVMLYEKTNLNLDTLARMPIDELFNDNSEQ